MQLNSKGFYIKKIIIPVARAMSKKLYNIQFEPSIIIDGEELENFVSRELNEYRKKFKEEQTAIVGTNKFVINPRSEYPIKIWINFSKEFNTEDSYEKTIYFSMNKLEVYGEEIKIEMSNNSILTLNKFITLVKLNFDRNVGNKIYSDTIYPIRDQYIRIDENNDISVSLLVYPMNRNGET